MVGKGFQANALDKIGIEELEEFSGYPGLGQWWKELQPQLNDFVHGGIGQLKGNPIDDKGWPRYPARWVWSCMLMATLLALFASSVFWDHIDHKDRNAELLKAVTSEDWGGITLARNGLPTRIVAL